MAVQGRRDRSASDRPRYRRRGRAHLERACDTARATTLAGQTRRGETVRYSAAISRLVSRPQKSWTSDQPARVFVTHSTRRSSPAVAMSLVPRRQQQWAELTTQGHEKEAGPREAWSAPARAVSQQVKQAGLPAERRALRDATRSTSFRSTTRRPARQLKLPREGGNSCHEKVATVCTGLLLSYRVRTAL